MSADDHIDFGAFQLDRSSSTLTMCSDTERWLEGQGISSVRVSVNYAFARKPA